jgi:ABC-type antimicrobial peptide transport system permease subunit
MTTIWNNSSGFNWPGKDPQQQSADFGIIAVSPEYGVTVGWEIVQGRDFSREFASDSTAILLNEAAVEFIGTKDPIGLELTRGNDRLHVVGVVKNLVMESPYMPVRHNIYFFDGKYEDSNWINIKLNPRKATSESLASIESILKKYAPSVPFDYKFVDDEYANKFATEEIVGKLATVFSGLAIFISCLGLIGLASFVAERYTKEIGIRKVLGASIPQLWKLLSGNFVLLVIISSVIAFPLVYFGMTSWLSRIPYHTDISWTTLLAVEVGVLGLTLLTVSYQALSAARANPVTSLRSE